MPRALLSVSDKAGIDEFASGLAELGWTLLSTGGTAALLRDAGLAVTDVSELTGHPEIMDGRVKTLHPAVHAGLLARRAHRADSAALRAHGYAPIDLLAVNLYPFHQAVAARAEIADAMEKVDIGGPAMLRAAAKNHAGVLVVVDPADYAVVLDAIRSGSVDEPLRRRLAARVFDHTARYDRAIADYFAARAGEAAVVEPRPAAADAAGLPNELTLRLRRVQALRYGENPDQPAAFYAEEQPPAGSLPALRQLHGRELSFNNLLDVDAAVMAVSAWAADEHAACAIIKHTTPCGLAVGDDARDAFRRALAADPTSAFGGVVAFSTIVGADAAAELARIFLEIIVAPGFDDGALAALQPKKNLRLIVLPAEAAGTELDYKRVRGGMLVQTRMRMRFPEEEWRVVTRREPDAHELAELRFAWRACATVKSNAIVIAREGRTIGIGAGQMSRVDASRIAVMKARDQNADTRGAVLASDAFFPFRDGIDAAAEAGIRAVIQPGGSVRDGEVIAAADEHGISMVLTGRRLFRH
jgi:phosphoribosylaminoimidazolecarboxamide formyltransferase / IMP cyclohydrolase